MAFQKQIDQRIRDLLAEFGVEHVVVRGTVEERIAQLLAAMKERT